MIDNESLSTYLKLMLASLEKKLEILDNILLYTKEQGRVLAENSISSDEKFTALMDSKEELIKEVNKLDEGFEMTYSRIKAELEKNPAKQRQLIEDMKALIKKLVEKGIEIQTEEQRNKLKFDFNLSKEKEKIRNYVKSSSVVSKYYNNMNKNPGKGTYFIDSKK